MKGTGTPRKQRGQLYAQPALVVALLALLPVAGCKHAPPLQSRSLTKDEHSQQPAAAPAPVEAPAPAQSGLEGPRFAVQVGLSTSEQTLRVWLPDSLNSTDFRPWLLRLRRAAKRYIEFGYWYKIRIRLRA
jgi:hypothetical protein